MFVRELSIINSNLETILEVFDMSVSKYESCNMKALKILNHKAPKNECNK